MPDLTTISDFPPWSIDYQFNQLQPVVRSQHRGYKRQSSHNHAQSTRAAVSRRIYGAMLPYFEYFIRSECDDGNLAFTDKYKDGGGVQTALVRIINGSYSVQTDGVRHLVRCEIEIFR